MASTPSPTSVADGRTRNAFSDWYQPTPTTAQMKISEGIMAIATTRDRTEAKRPDRDTAGGMLIRGSFIHLARSEPGVLGERAGEMVAER